MAITVSGIKKVNAYALLEVGGAFGSAHSSFTNAETIFSRDVVNAIDAGQAWTGAGQPQASTTARNNAVAMSIGALRMEAAQNALIGLHGALNTAQSRVQSVVYEAEARTKPGTVIFEVKDGGEVDFRSSQENDNYREDLEWAISAQAELKGALAFATAADIQAQQLLDSITWDWPRFTDTADTTALSFNLAALEDALDANVVSKQLRDLWENAQPVPIPEDPNWLQRNIGTIAELLLTGVSLIPGAGWVVRAGSVGLRLSGRLPKNAKPGPKPEQPKLPKEPEGPEPIPQNVQNVRDYIGSHNGTPPPGTKGNKNYENNPRFDPENHPNNPLGEKLPEKTYDGKTIQYKEYDVHPKVQGQNRGEERIVVGYVDGKPVSSWYTKDHYHTFIPIE